MNRDDFQRLSQLRVQEAKALIDAGHYAGAYYLLGYAIECALKACIAKQTKRYDFPDKTTVNKSYTHNLEQLLNVSGLEEQLKTDRRENEVLGSNWAVVKDWTEESRYNISIIEVKATDFYLAATEEENGVLAWLMERW